MHLKYPICLTIIVPIIIVFMIGLWLRRKSRPTVFIPHLSAFRDISVSPFRKIFTLILETISAISLLILVILFVIISARPQQKIEKTQSKSGLDIVMLLDGSGSMFYSLDDTVTQSPLEASRLVIKNFV